MWMLCFYRFRENHILNVKTMGGGISINNTGQWIRYEREIEGEGVMLLSGVCKERKYR